MDYGNDDGYPVELDSDQEAAIDSSDDEFDIMLYGTPDQRHKLEKRIGKPASLEGQEMTAVKSRPTDPEGSSSEDEFEKEMTEELNATMEALEQKHKAAAPSQESTATPAQSSTETEAKYYDNEYFDSDSDDEGTREEKKAQKRPVISNDDLLYDPEADADDQRWVDSQRRRYQPHAAPAEQAQWRGRQGLQQQQQQQQHQQQRLPNSDAILNCPACMVQLCLDCQRHEKYKNQYRAMFVMNCHVNKEQQLRFPETADKRRKRQKKGPSNETDPESFDTGLTQGSSSDDKYNPVTCTQCHTEVGVYDTDEVFHFFNVLASHS